MKSYLKTTLLVLFLLNVINLTQTENLESRYDSESSDREENISQREEENSLLKLENINDDAKNIFKGLMNKNPIERRDEQDLGEGSLDAIKKYFIRSNEDLGKEFADSMKQDPLKMILNQTCALMKTSNDSVSPFVRILLTIIQSNKQLEILLNSNSFKHFLSTIDEQFENYCKNFVPSIDFRNFDWSIGDENIKRANQREEEFLDELDDDDPNKRFDFLALLENFWNKYGIRFSNVPIDKIISLITGSDTEKTTESDATMSMRGIFDTDREDTESQTDPTIDFEESDVKRRNFRRKISLEKVFDKYCELHKGSSNGGSTTKALLAHFAHKIHPNNTHRSEHDESTKFLRSLKILVDREKNGKRKVGYELPFLKKLLKWYCDVGDESSSESDEENDYARRAVFVKLNGLDSRGRKSKQSAVMDFVRYSLQKICLDELENSRGLIKTRQKRSPYEDVFSRGQADFEPSRGKMNMVRSSPNIIRKPKIRRLKKTKDMKNRIVNLYNPSESNAEKKDYENKFPRDRVIGHKDNPSTSFEVKTGVERDMGSKDSNPRLRCKVTTKASMSDVDGRTGTSRGRTFSEVPTDDSKTLLCSSETAEVHRPNKETYIKKSVSGKSVVSYDNPDKYIQHKYSPSKENLEIGTSAFAALNDTSNKNQSVSVVSTDSQNADSFSRSETKFLYGKDTHRGMESSANVEGSIKAVPNKNPFITSSRKRSFGMVVENPDKNMENPLPVEKNEKLQTYSKFQGTQDFDINFRRFDQVPRSHIHPRQLPR